MPTNPAKFSSILALLAAMFIVSCAPVEEEPPPPSLSPPIGSIIGVWTINETNISVTHARCFPPATTYILYVAQNGNTAIAQVGSDVSSPYDPTAGSNGTQSSGFISGSTLALDGPNPDGMGTMNTARLATVSPGCNLLAGTRTISYSDSTPFSCSGTLSFTGARTLGSGCAGTLAATAVPESSIAHNTALTAQVIATRPAEVSGTISNGEEDWYSFTLPGAEDVTILLNGPAAPQNIDLFLTDAAGTLMPPLASSQGSILSSREAVAWDNLTAGTYLIRVSATSVGVTASYKLLIQ